MIPYILQRFKVQNLPRYSCFLSTLHLLTRTVCSPMPGSPFR